MQSTAATPSPTGRKKPHCRTCGLPMEGHRRGECEDSTEPSGSGSQNDSDDNADLTPAGSNGEVKDTTSLKTPRSSPFRVTRASYKAAQNQNDDQFAVGCDRDPVIRPPTDTPPKQKTKTITNLKSKRLSTSRNDDGGLIPVITDQEDSSSFDGQEQKPLLTAVETNPKAETSTDSALKHEEDALPSPNAVIYASSDFLKLGEAGAALRDRLRLLENTEGKEGHVGIFYTPTPVRDRKSYAYKEWIVVGRGEGSEALVKHIVRLADSQSVLRNRAPGTFVVGGELEVVEGPRIVTIPQLVFGSFVAVVLLMYVLSTFIYPVYREWFEASQNDENSSL
ncbi:hypothetical protein F5876DRAFT_64352 [Lentinula aff. lateritia]|uniref:Uncharacterized protein n=1 Tax=Lentinula aff. lateritia TaxID=2804960 RepID=A0ACC1U4J6_9AGAR|nr:hypothetical protein F5876DRAFT_64352 [Lentinula aff. lateritia]